MNPHIKPKFSQLLNSLSVFTVALYLFLPSPAWANNEGRNIGTGFADVKEAFITGSHTTIREVIVAITAGLLVPLSVIAMAVIVYGGFLILTSVGNEERTARGKKALIYAMAGMIVIGLSAMIVNALLKAA